MTKNDCIKKAQEISPENLTQDDKKLLEGIKESIESFINDIKSETTLIPMMLELIGNNEKMLVLRNPMEEIMLLKQEELKEWEKIQDIIEALEKD